MSDHTVQGSFSRNTQVWMQLYTSDMARSHKGWSLSERRFLKLIASLETQCAGVVGHSLWNNRTQLAVSTGRSRVHLEWVKKVVLMLICFSACMVHFVGCIVHCLHQVVTVAYSKNSQGGSCRFCRTARLLHSFVATRARCLIPCTVP